MEAEITRAMIVNWALIDLGHPASFTDDANDQLGGIVDLVWPRVVDRTFGLHDWTFCRRTKKLPRLEATPETGWKHAFTLPGDKVGDPLKMLSDPRRETPLRDFYLEGNEVHADVTDVWARCRVLVDPRYWDPAFRSAFVTALASALAVPVMHDEDGAANLYAKAFGSPSQGGAGGEFGRLIAQNMAASPVGSPLASYDPLVTARWS